ncbi:MAG: DNA polymerase II large subunit [Candidatus Woesearchaeota archaeon]
MKESEDMKKYFLKIEKDVLHAYDVSTSAKSLGFDPENSVDIKIAKNMAERVEGLISAVAPKLVGSGMAKRIIELEEEYSPLDWRVALIIGKEVAMEKFCKFDNKKLALEIGIRVGFAYHTSGIVAAPLEGFIELKIKKRKDGKEYLCPCYAGPIRGAGGTAAAFSLILCDYVRVMLGYDKWDPTNEEISRIKTEIVDYHERVTNLQYFPYDEELDFLLNNLPIEVSGDPTEKFEVSNYKDIERIGTNRIRGGVCLVLAEGLSQKAPKIWKRLEKWGNDFSLDWNFLKEFLDLKKKLSSGKNNTDTKNSEKPKITPNYTFIKDLVAGRPVLSFPMANRGFRLRYGRTRISGFSTASINPATMVILDKFIATGTQLKIERPGKAASVVPCDEILGPVVKLDDGNVVCINDMKKAKELNSRIKRILFLGDILFNYGDFSENNHALVPCGFNEEWWLLELEKSCLDKFKDFNSELIFNHCKISKEKIKEILKNPLTFDISFEDALVLSKSFNIPIHPKYNYFWNLITNEELILLVRWLKFLNLKKEDDKIIKAILPYKLEEKKIIENLCIPHILVNNEFVVFEYDFAHSFLYSLGYFNFLENSKILNNINLDESILKNINNLSSILINDKAGTFIGARMGRPEKAKQRKIHGSPHSLFPVGEEGGRFKSFQASNESGFVNSEFILRKCENCNNETVYTVCELCNFKTKQLYYCRSCDKILTTKECKIHGENLKFNKRKIDIKNYFNCALKKIKTRVYPELIKGVKETKNQFHYCENLVKGILRAKNNVFVNKDGTVRYDMTELPMTHFKPFEINVSIEKLKELGYNKDIYGKNLVDIQQIIELKPHDIVLPASKETLDEPSNDVLFRITKYIDELLVSLYKQKPYYNLKNKNELIGHYVIGLAPHISCGTVARIIGFSKTQGFFAHPLMHAAFRRDCDGDEAAVIMLMDAFLNFSREFLPNSRGAKTMDAPLVLNYKIIPSEVDDMVHGLDVVSKYELDFYNGAMNYLKPFEIKIDQLNKFLNTKRQYEGFGFTHNIFDINCGINFSAYKSLPSMEEKLKGQMTLAEKIDAVDESEVARFVIEKHFLKDIKGNLRKFSMQQFRCVKCNQKYRRPPLSGKCKCMGKLIFTISQGSVIKYLEPSLSLAKNYNVSKYLQQSLELLNQRVDEVFGREKEKQEGLGKWFG